MIKQGYLVSQTFHSDLGLREGTHRIEEFKKVRDELDDLADDPCVASVKIIAVGNDGKTELEIYSKTMHRGKDETNK